jgi:hypothetical protein
MFPVKKTKILRWWKVQRVTVNKLQRVTVNKLQRATVDKLQRVLQMNLFQFSSVQLTFDKMARGCVCLSVCLCETHHIFIGLAHLVLHL